MSEIGGLGIAHNDLQHGNVMVESDRYIRLVDYDAMFLPQYYGQASPENRHQNFQHPMKTSRDYNENVDRFPALVIYLSLLAIAADPGLFHRYNNDDNLIFKKSDYADPSSSECFRALKTNNPDDAVRHLAQKLEEFCSIPVDQVPELEEVLGQTPAYSPAPASRPAPSAPPPAPVPASQARSTGSAYRDLLQGLIPNTTPVNRPAARPTLTLTCAGCGQSNSLNLIYCENASCVAVLHQGRQFCAGCGGQTPSNAVYCPECGRVV